jgi:hypothetical protein
LQTYNIVSDPALESISNFNPNVGVGALYKSWIICITFNTKVIEHNKGANTTDGFASVVTGSPPCLFKQWLWCGYKFKFIFVSVKTISYDALPVPLSVDFTTMLQIEKTMR